MATPKHLAQDADLVAQDGAGVLDVARGPLQVGGSSSCRPSGIGKRATAAGSSRRGSMASSRPRAASVGLGIGWREVVSMCGLYAYGSALSACER
jgi:hypothetical protein